MATTDDTDGQLWGELWLRRDTYGTYDVQQSVRDRVHELESRGVLGDSTVSGWGTEQLTYETDCRSAVLAVLEAFETWAERNDVSLEPAFERRELSPLLSSESYEVAVFPVVCLVLYEGNDLRGVFPVHDDDEVHTVEDCLDALEAGEAEELLDRLGEPVEPSETASLVDQPPLE